MSVINNVISHSFTDGLCFVPQSIVARVTHDVYLRFRFVTLNAV